jgi:purine-binding chemotaxis protein CheW
MAGRDPASDDPPAAPDPAQPDALVIPEVEPGVPAPDPAAGDFAHLQPGKSEAHSESSAEHAPLPGEKLLVFDLVNEKYAIPIHDIAQIIDLPVTTPVPNAPAFLAGIFSLRGRIVSIIDVARRLRVERPEAEALKVIVLDVAQDHFGLLVDRIDQVVDVNLASLEPPPEGFKPMAQDFVEGVFHLKGRAVGFLNLPMFLDFEV